MQAKRLADNARRMDALGVPETRSAQIESFARLDDPRAVVARRVRARMRFFLFGGALVMIVPWAMYVLATAYQINPLEWGRPAREVELFLLVASVPVSVGGACMVWLALRRYRPLCVRGAQTMGWVEDVGSSAAGQFRPVTFGYEVGGVRYTVKRAQPEVEVALYDERTEIAVVYDIERPARSDVVVRLAEESDRLTTRLRTAVEVSAGDFGWRVLQILLAAAHYGMLFLAYTLCPAAKESKDRLIVPLVLGVLGAWFWECYALERWRARRRGEEYVAHWVQKAHWALWVVGPGGWFFWELVRIVRGSK